MILILRLSLIKKMSTTALIATSFIISLSYLFYNSNDNYNKLILKSIADFKDKSLKSQTDLNKFIIRKTAIEFLNKNWGFNQARTYTINEYPGANSRCFQDKINKFKDVYDQLLRIDYDNYIVSFAYYWDDSKNNFMTHPLYKLINQTLEFDNLLLSNVSYNENYNYVITGDLSNIILYNKERFAGIKPFKGICGYPSYELHNNELIKIYDEFEYISTIISFVSIPPVRFL